VTGIAVEAGVSASANATIVSEQLAEGNAVELMLSDNVREAQLSSNTISAIIEAGENLVISDIEVSVIIPANVLSQINTGETVSINVSVGGQDIISADNLLNRPLEISILVDGAQITELEDTLTIVVDLSEEDLTASEIEALAVIVYDQYGAEVGVIQGEFDHETGMFSFSISNLDNLFELTVRESQTPQAPQAPQAPQTPQVPQPFQLPAITPAVQENQENFVIQAVVGESGFNINGTASVMDVPPTIVEGRTLVPVRFFAEAFGADVGWNSETRTVTITYQGRTMSFVIGEASPGMDVPAQIIDDRTMVPLRFISEFFGATVHWDEETGIVTVERDN